MIVNRVFLLQGNIMYKSARNKAGLVIIDILQRNQQKNWRQVKMQRYINKVRFI